MNHSYRCMGMLVTTTHMRPTWHLIKGRKPELDAVRSSRGDVLPFTRILIPIDFSERCLGAARFAIPLAERFHSEITFLHVKDPPVAESDLNTDPEEHVEKLLRDFLLRSYDIMAGDPDCRKKQLAVIERSQFGR